MLNPINVIKYKKFKNSIKRIWITIV